MAIGHPLIKKIQRLNAQRELSIYARKIRKESDKTTKRDELLNIVFDKYYRFFNIKQLRSEINSLCEVIESKQPKCVVEIGTAGGGSLFLFCKLAHPDATIISIDLQNGEFGGGYDDIRIPFYQSFVTPHQSLHLIRANSHSRTTRDNVVGILEGTPIDFLFIDGDHTYEGVKEDFYNYGSLVGAGGIVALHDIVAHSRQSSCKVAEFWQELKKEHANTQEIISSDNQGWAGIGIVHK